MMPNITPAYRHHKQVSFCDLGCLGHVEHDCLREGLNKQAQMCAEGCEGVHL